MRHIIHWGGGTPVPYRSLADFARRLWKDESGGPLALLAPLGLAGASALAPATMAGLMGTAAAAPVAGAGLIPAGSSLLAPGAIAPITGGGFAATGPIAGAAAAPVAAGTVAGAPAAAGIGLKEIGSIASTVMGMFGGADVPEAPDTETMPDPDDMMLSRKNRRDYSAQRQKSGRLSTINTDEPLG